MEGSAARGNHVSQQKVNLHITTYQWSGVMTTTPRARSGPQGSKSSSNPDRLGKGDVPNARQEQPLPFLPKAEPLRNPSKEVVNLGGERVKRTEDRWMPLMGAHRLPPATLIHMSLPEPTNHCESTPPTVMPRRGPGYRYGWGRPGQVGRVRPSVG